MSGGSFAQVFLGEDLAFFHRGLIERIDPKRITSKNRFQHEMHQQFAEAALVQGFDMNTPGRIS